MSTQRNVSWPRLAPAIAIPQAAGGLGAMATRDGMKEWYPSLKKPLFNPPAGVFGPVWTTLYLMMGIAQYLVSCEGRDEQSRNLVRRGENLYALQLGLNTGWSLLFFKLRMPLVALIEFCVLLVAIGLTIQAFARLSHRRPATGPVSRLVHVRGRPERQHLVAQPQSLDASSTASIWTEHAPYPRPGDVPGSRNVNTPLPIDSDPSLYTTYAYSPGCSTIRKSVVSPGWRLISIPSSAISNR